MTQLYQTIKSMEDILRNGSSKLTVNDAFQEITNLLLLKFIEPKIQDCSINELIDPNEHIVIDQECCFTFIYNKYCVDYNKKIMDNTIKKGDLYDLLYNESRHINRYYNTDIECMVEDDNYDFTKMCIFKKLFHHKTLSLTFKASWKKYFKFEIQDESDIVECFHKIHSVFNNFELYENNRDFFGDAFEKYRDGVFGSKSGLGQYFTNKFIIQKILNEVKLTITDKIYDPAAGAGGFFINSYSYLKNQYNETEINNFCQNNIYGNEVDSNIFKVLQLNAYIYGFKIDNFQLCDSINLKNHKENEFDVMIYNPPFGASFNVPKLFPIDIKNSVGLFLQLGFKALKKNGRCGVVVDRGILNNGSTMTSWQTKIRKELIKNRLKKIILLPEKSFQYTNFAVCIIIYDRSCNDNIVVFEEGYFLDSDKGTRIKPIYFKEIGTVTYNDIKEKNYSLKYEDYFNVQEKDDEKSEYIKLENICELLKNCKHKAGDAIENGLYNYYTSSNIIKKSNFNDYASDAIIVGSGGNGSIFIDKNFSCSADNFLISNTKMDIKYIYYYLKLTFKELYKLYTGNGLKHLSKQNLLNYKIPNIPLNDQTEIVSILDKYFEIYNIDEFIKYLGNFNIFSVLLNKQYEKFDIEKNGFQSYIKIIKDFEEIIMKQNWFLQTKRQYIKIINKGYDIINVGNKIEIVNELFTSLINLMIEKENIKNRKDIYCESLFNKIKCKSEIKSLGEIVKYVKYEHKKDEHKKENGKYPFYNSSIINHLYCNEYTNEDECLIINKVNGTGKTKIYYNNGKFSATSGVIIFKSKLLNISNRFLYYYLTFNKKKIESKYTGSDKKSLSKNNFESIKIPIPSLEIQQDIINKIENMELETSHYNIYDLTLKQEIENLQEIIINLTCNNIELIQENEIYDDINLNDASDNDIDNESDNEENIINNNI
jgi:type I restriction-modification system DNA methylase subunit/restriction endonuclease S subunit